MKICYKNILDEIVGIIKIKAKFQKVMLVFDDNVSNIEINEIYQAIKDFCVYNQMNMLNIDNDEIYNGYKLIIYVCCVDSYLKTKIKKEEFINVFVPIDNCLLPYFLNSNCTLESDNDYLIIDNSKIDLQMIASSNFNQFFDFLRNISLGQKRSINFNLLTNSHSDIMEFLKSNNEKLLFLDMDILIKADIEYKYLVLIDLLLIDAFLLLITSLKNEKLMLVDVYKSAKEDYEMIDKFYKLYNNKTFENLVKLNYNCLYNYCLKTKQIILELVSLIEIDLKVVEDIIYKIKEYAKKENELLSYLYLFNVFNV